MSRFAYLRGDEPFDVYLDAERYAPGQTITGRLDPRGPVPSGRIDVALEYREHVPNFAHVARRVDGVALETRQLQPGQALPFSIALPADAEPPIEVERGSVKWWVVVRVGKREAYRDVPL